jgi:Methyltransferase FkbM domain
MALDGANMRIGRGEFLAGLGGLAVGVPVGAIGRGYQRAASPAPTTIAPAAAPPGPPGPSELSFAQAGEDVIVNFLFNYLQQFKDIQYLDIGAWDPVTYNNTYFFYRKGFRGVLVEPNVAMCQKIRAVRPEDTTLEAGIGVTAEREADYYMMNESGWNTFSKDEADHMTKVTGGRIRVEKVIKMPLLNINDVMAKHFGKAPAYVSIDAEGLHLAILKSIDYRRFRPLAICVETLVSGSRAAIPEIPAYMASQGYVNRGGSFVNTIFVDGKRI